MRLSVDIHGVYERGSCYRSFIRIQAAGEYGHGEALWQVARSGTTFSLEGQKILILLKKYSLSLPSFRLSRDWVVKDARCNDITIDLRVEALVCYSLSERFMTILQK